MLRVPKLEGQLRPLEEGFELGLLAGVPPDLTVLKVRKVTAAHRLPIRPHETLARVVKAWAQAALVVQRRRRVLEDPCGHPTVAQDPVRSGLDHRAHQPRRGRGPINAGTATAAELPLMGIECGREGGELSVHKGAATLPPLEDGPVLLREAHVLRRVRFEEQRMVGHTAAGRV